MKDVGSPQYSAQRAAIAWANWHGLEHQAFELIYMRALSEDDIAWLNSQLVLSDAPYRYTSDPWLEKVHT